MDGSPFVMYSRCSHAARYSCYPRPVASFKFKIPPPKHPYGSIIANSHKRKPKHTQGAFFILPYHPTHPFKQSSVGILTSVFATSSLVVVIVHAARHIEQLGIRGAYIFQNALCTSASFLHNKLIKTPTIAPKTSAFMSPLSIPPPLFFRSITSFA